MRAANHRVDFLTISPDGDALVTGVRGQPLHWWDLPHSINSAFTIPADRAVFSADGRTLAAFDRSNTVQMWDVSKRTLRNNVVLDSPPDFELALSPDGRVLATTYGREDYENSIRLWDTISGKQLGVCLGHKQPPRSLVFSPDGKTLASASDDSTVKLWNTATQQELLSFGGAGERVDQLTFSPDQRYLVGRSSSSQQGQLRVFAAGLLKEKDVPKALNK